MVPYQDCIPKDKSFVIFILPFLFGYFPGDDDVTIGIVLGVLITIIVVGVLVVAIGRCCCQKWKQTGM